MQDRTDTSDTVSESHTAPGRIRIEAVPRRFWILLGIPLLVALCGATDAGAQTAPPPVVEPVTGDLTRGPLVAAVPESGGGVCAGGGEDPVVRGARRALVEPDRERAVTALHELETGARTEVEAHPDSALPHYRLAAVLGARAELKDGDDVELASDVYRHADRALALEPDHPGAHYMLGRLHAAVMRLGRIKRFLAKTFIGGDLLGTASWRAAEHHLRRAEGGDPCVFDHHYELAKLYVDRDRRGPAIEELRHVFRMVGGEPDRWAEARAKAGALAAELGGG